MKLSISLLVLLSIVYGQNKNSLITDLKPTIILVSLDGYHPSYIEKSEEGHLARIAKEGVRARWMIPVFPTKTFPNHYSIVTGLYPANHGIVHNTIYDPVFKSVFSLGNRKEVQDGRWWHGEPIWITAEKNNIKTAPFFFPGSEAPIKGIHPSYWLAYDGKLPNSDRVDMVLNLLDLPAAERPQFFTLYFSDLDDAGHNYSMESKEVYSSIVAIDSTLGRLVNGLKSRGIYDQLNIIIVSDHGMADVYPDNIIILDDYFDKENVEQIIWDGQLTGIVPKAGKEHIVYKELKSGTPEHVSIFHKSETHESFHYSFNRRIPEILCLADEGWVIMSRSNYEQKKKNNGLATTKTGAHGYDNRLQSMRAIFVARGSAFKKGLVAEPFANIQLYNMMTKILNITPAKNNGGWDVAKQVLK